MSPTVGSFHPFYWNGVSQGPPAGAGLVGGYPLWQTSAVTLGCGFGGMSPWWERLMDRLRWSWIICRRTLRFDREQRAIVLATLDSLEHPAFPLARQAVRQTATTLGFTRPEAWKELSRELKGSAGHAENAFRHLEACRLVRANLLGEPISNPRCHLVVELAYQGFAAFAVGSSGGQDRIGAHHL